MRNEINYLILHSIKSTPPSSGTWKPDCASNDSLRRLWAQSNNTDIPNILYTVHKRINHARNSMKSDAVHYQNITKYHKIKENIMCSPFSQRFARRDSMNSFHILKWRNKNQICVLLRVLNLRDDSIFYRHQIPLNCYGRFEFTGGFWWNHCYNILWRVLYWIGGIRGWQLRSLIFEVFIEFPIHVPSAYPPHTLTI